MLNRSTTRIFWLCAAVVAASTLPMQAFSNARTVAAFNPQPDPPGFGLVHIFPGSGIRINGVCFDHPVGKLFPPGPCRGELMFHDATGNVVKRAAYDLKPGETTSLEWITAPTTDVIADVLSLIGVVPCVLPAPGSIGLLVPAVEVYIPQSGRTAHFIHPATPGMSNFEAPNPAAKAGFNPQPDPPGFGPLTLSTGQGVRTNIVCFDHPVNDVPPGPCRGQVMFHDGAGNVLKTASVDLKPGESFTMGIIGPERGGITINPCWIPGPDNAGRSIPSVEVFDQLNGGTLLFINPAAAGMTAFQGK